jgi:hypothetical protein
MVVVVMMMLFLGAAWRRRVVSRRMRRAPGVAVRLVGGFEGTVDPAGAERSERADQEAYGAPPTAGRRQGVDEIVKPLGVHGHCSYHVDAGEAVTDAIATWMPASGRGPDRA